MYKWRSKEAPVPSATASLMNLPSRLPYPETRKGDLVETIHGIPVPDPYRWLEDPDLDGAGIAPWLDQQNALTFSVIRASDPSASSGGDTRDRLLKRLTEVWNYPKYGVIKKAGGRYFFWLNSGLQNQPVLYMQNTLGVEADGRGARENEPKPVLDPNLMSPDGTTAITAQSWTDDGWLLGYALSRSGSDWQELRVLDLETLKELDDVIRHCKFTRPAWTRDQSGFFYSRFPEPGTVPPEEESYHQKVYWHTLDTKQEADPLVYARPDAPELGFSPHVTDDGRYLILHVWKGTDPKNRIYYAPLADGAARPSQDDVVRLLDEQDARYDFIDNVEGTFYFNTDLDAPRGRVIAIDVSRPEREQWREIIPQG